MSTDAHGNRPGKLARDLQFDGALRPHRYSTGLNPESARVETREWRFVNSYADSGENAYLTGSYQRQAPFSAFVLRQDSDAPVPSGAPARQAQGTLFEYSDDTAEIFMKDAHGSNVTRPTRKRSGKPAPPGSPSPAHTPNREDRRPDTRSGRRDRATALPVGAPHRGGRERRPLWVHADDLDERGGARARPRDSGYA